MRSSPRVRLAAGLAALFAVAGVAVVLLAAGGDDEQAAEKGYGRLSWAEKPRVYRFPTIPSDRVLSGQVRNASFKEVDLVARRDVKLVDARGRSVDHAATFAPGYGRDIYPPRYLRAIPEADQVRLGIKAKLKPGQTVPLTLSWREKRGAPRPVRVELPGGGLLALPTR